MPLKNSEIRSISTVKYYLALLKIRFDGKYVQLTFLHKILDDIDTPLKASDKHVISKIVDCDKINGM